MFSKLLAFIAASAPGTTAPGTAASGTAASGTAATGTAASGTTAEKKTCKRYKKGPVTFTQRRSLLSKNAPTGGTHNPTKSSNKRKRSEEPKQKKTKADCKVHTGFKRVVHRFLTPKVSKKYIVGICDDMWKNLSTEDHQTVRWDSLLHVEAGHHTSRMHELYRKVTMGESPATRDGALSAQMDASVAAVREPSPPPALEPKPTRPTTGGKSMERVEACRLKLVAVDAPKLPVEETARFDDIEPELTESDSHAGDITESEADESSLPGSPLLDSYHNPEPGRKDKQRKTEEPADKGPRELSTGLVVYNNFVRQEKIKKNLNQMAGTLVTAERTTINFLNGSKRALWELYGRENPEKILSDIEIYDAVNEVYDFWFMNRQKPGAEKFKLPLDAGENQRGSMPESQPLDRCTSVEDNPDANTPTSPLPRTPGRTPSPERSDSD